MIGMVQEPLLKSHFKGFSARRYEKSDPIIYSSVVSTRLLIYSSVVAANSASRSCYLSQRSKLELTREFQCHGTYHKVGVDGHCICHSCHS